jgi:tetratricopeptide (TPR) repeat protein
MMLKRLRGNITQDLLAGLINILAAIEASGTSGIIIIDQIENASEAVQEALLGLAVQLPPRWNILIAVNDEVTEGVDYLNTFWPRLAYSNAAQNALKPLDIRAIERWCLDERGSVPSTLELRSVLANCQGRPLLLREWVSGASTEAEIANIWQRLGPYYQKRLNALGREARALIRSLALLPAQSQFPLPLITKILGANSSSQAFETVEELINAQFLEEDAEETDSYRFVHDVTKRQVAKSTPRAVAKEAAGKVVVALRELEPERLDAQHLYTLATLEYQAGDYDQFVADALPAATSLLSDGSYAPALELYHSCFSLEPALLDSSAEVAARLGMAATLHATGYYHEGLQLIQESTSWPLPHRAQAMLWEARLLLRLDQFHDARSMVAQARYAFEGFGDREGVIQCDKEDVTLLRDLGRYSEAVDKSLDLVSHAEQNLVSTKVLGSCYRALARSLAFTGPTERALEAGNRALQLGVESHSPSDVGNARLSLGEAYRLGRRPNLAIPEYEAAADIALSVGNRDSYLWSMLGLSDAHLLLGELPLAQDILTPIEDIVKPKPDRYPLEYLHWQLSHLCICHLLGTQDLDGLLATVRAYDELGVIWPGYYLSALMEAQRLPPKRF